MSMLSDAGASLARAIHWQDALWRRPELRRRLAACTGAPVARAAEVRSSKDIAALNRPQDGGFYDGRTQASPLPLRPRPGHHLRGRGRRSRRVTAPICSSKTDSLILAIETSCDETAVAVLRGRGELLASEVASQIDLHRAYGGVVPEAASRQHLRELPLLLDHTLPRPGVTLADVDAFAATSGPGLASSLMIGAARGQGSRARGGQAVPRRQPPRRPPAFAVLRRRRRGSVRRWD